MNLHFNATHKTDNINFEIANAGVTREKRTLPEDIGMFSFCLHVHPFVVVHNKMMSVQEKKKGRLSRGHQRQKQTALG